MASGGVMTHHDMRSLTMKSDKLSVQGTGITPRPSTPTHDVLLPSGIDPTSPTASSRASVTSDDEASRSAEDEEANSMLQGVLNMNKVLEGQVEALRLRLQVEDKQHRDAKDKLRLEKDAVIVARESDIGDLKDSLANRDDRIQNLVRASEEKDRQMEKKVAEIEELKKLVKQTEEYAHTLHRQIGKVRHEKQNLESDSLYREQNEEIARLTEEIRQLKTRLTGMEQEIHRAALIIQEQSTKIRQMEEGRGAVHANFKEELDKATRAMRQEVERMREVMRQNYEEMRQLREQNKLMHNDVKDIKNLLMNRMFQPPSQQQQQQQQQHQQQQHQQQQQAPLGPTTRAFGVRPGVQRPLTASPVHLFKPTELDSLVISSHVSSSRSHQSPTPSPQPKGGPSPHGPNQGVNTARQGRAGAGGAGEGPGGGLGAGPGGPPHPNVRQSSEALPSSRAPSRAGQLQQKAPRSAKGASSASGPPPTGAGAKPSSTAGAPAGAGPSGGGKGVFPAICTMKEEPAALPAVGRSAGQQQLHRAKSGVRSSMGKGGKK